MNEFDYMSHPEQLSALLDGEFEVGDASNLFFELAQNPELQEQFRDHLLMKKFIAKSFTAPPEHLKQNILIGTGLISSTALTLGGLAVNPIGKFLLNAIKSRGLMMGFSALLGSLATIFYLNFINPDINAPSSYTYHPPSINNSSHYNSLEKIYTANSADNDNKSIHQYSPPPVITSNESESNFKYNNQKIHTDGANSLFPVDNLNENETNITRQPDNINLSNVIAQSDIQPISVNSLSELPSINSPKIDLINIMPAIRNFSLQVRHFTMASIPQVNIPPLDKPALNNIGLSLAYHYTDDIIFGLECGQENFQQKYFGKDSIIEQNYLAFWIGAYYQQSLDKIQELAGIQPFVRAFVGGTKIGPYLRGMLGIQYPVYKQFYIFSALESSILFYRYNRNNFTTQKFGLTYGVFVKF